MDRKYGSDAVFNVELNRTSKHSFGSLVVC